MRRVFFLALLVLLFAQHAEDASAMTSPGQFNQESPGGGEVCLADMNVTGIDAVLDPWNGKINLYLYTVDENYTKTSLSNGGVFVYKIQTIAGGGTTVTASRVTTDANGRAYVAYDPAQPPNGCVAYTFTYCPLPYTKSAMNACFKVPRDNLVGGFQDNIWCDTADCIAIPCNPQDDPCVPAPRQNPGNLPSQANVTYCNRQNLDLTDLCWPLMIILGILMGAMFAAGHSPFSAFDFSSPRLSRGKQYQMRPKSMSIDVTSIVMGANKLSSVGGAVIGAGKTKGKSKDNADGTKTLTDGKGKVVGKVDAKGNVFDAKGNAIGKLDAKGNIISGGNKVGSIGDNKFSMNGSFKGGVFKAGPVSSGSLKSKLGGDFDSRHPGVVSWAGGKLGNLAGSGVKAGINASGLGGVGASLKKSIGGLFEKRGTDGEKSPIGVGKINLVQGGQMTAGSKLLPGKKQNEFQQAMAEKRKVVAEQRIAAREKESGGKAPPSGGTSNQQQRTGGTPSTGPKTGGENKDGAKTVATSTQKVPTGGYGGGGFTTIAPDATTPVNMLFGWIKGAKDEKYEASKALFATQSAKRGWSGVGGIFSTLGKNLVNSYAKSMLNDALFFVVPALVLRGKLNLGGMQGIANFGAKAMLVSQYGATMWLPPGAGDLLAGMKSGLNEGLFTPTESENKAQKALGASGGLTNEWKKVDGQLQSLSPGLDREGKIASLRGELGTTDDPAKRAKIEKEIKKLESEMLLIGKLHDQLAKTPKTERLAVVEGKDGKPVLAFITGYRDELRFDSNGKAIHVTVPDILRAAKPSEVGEIAAASAAVAQHAALLYEKAVGKYDKLAELQAQREVASDARDTLNIGDKTGAETLMKEAGLMPTEQGPRGEVRYLPLSAEQMHQILDNKIDGLDRKMGEFTSEALDILNKRGVAPGDLQRVQELMAKEGVLPSPKAMDGLMQQAEDEMRKGHTLPSAGPLTPEENMLVRAHAMKEILSERMMEKYDWVLDASRADSKYLAAQAAAGAASEMERFSGKGDWWLATLIGTAKSTDLNSALKAASDSKLAREAFEANTDAKRDEYGTLVDGAKELAGEIGDKEIREYTNLQVRVDALEMQIGIAEANNESTAKLEREQQELGKMPQNATPEAHISALDAQILEAREAGRYTKELEGQRAQLVSLQERINDIAQKHTEIVQAEAMGSHEQAEAGKKLIMDDINAHLSLIGLYNSAYDSANDSLKINTAITEAKAIGYGSDLFFKDKEEREAERQSIVEEAEKIKADVERLEGEREGVKDETQKAKDLDSFILDANHQLAEAQVMIGFIATVNNTFATFGEAPKEDVDYRAKVKEIVMGAEGGSVSEGVVNAAVHGARGNPLESLSELRERGGYGELTSFAQMHLNAAQALGAAYQAGAISGVDVVQNAQKIDADLMQKLQADPVSAIGEFHNVGIASSQFGQISSFLGGIDPQDLQKATGEDRKIVLDAVAAAITNTSEGISHGSLAGAEFLKLGEAASNCAVGYGDYLHNAIKVNEINYSSGPYREELEDRTRGTLEKIDELSKLVHEGREQEALSGMARVAEQQKEEQKPAGEPYGPPAPQMHGDYVHSAIAAIGNMPLTEDEQNALSKKWVSEVDSRIEEGSNSYDQKIAEEFKWLTTEGGKSEEHAKLALAEYFESGKSAEKMIEKKTGGHPEFLSDEDKSLAIVAIAFRGVSGGAREVGASIEKVDDGQFVINNDELMRRTMGANGANYLASHLDTYQAVLSATAPAAVPEQPASQQEAKAAEPVVPAAAEPEKIGDMLLEWRVKAICAQSQVERLEALSERAHYDIENGYFKGEQLRGAQEMLSEINSKLHGTDGNGGFEAAANMAAQTIDYVQTDAFLSRPDAKERLAELGKTFESLIEKEPEIRPFSSSGIETFRNDLMERGIAQDLDANDAKKISSMENGSRTDLELGGRTYIVEKADDGTLNLSPARQPGFEAVMDGMQNAIEQSENAYNIGIASQPKTRYRDINAPPGEMPEFEWLVGGHGQAGIGAQQLTSETEALMISQIGKNAWSDPANVEDPVRQFGAAVHIAAIAPEVYGAMDYLPERKEDRKDVVGKMLDYQSEHYRSTAKIDIGLKMSVEDARMITSQSPLAGYNAKDEIKEYREAVNEYMRGMAQVDRQEMPDEKKKRDDLHQELMQSQKQFRLQIVRPAGSDDLRMPKDAA